MGLFIGLFFLLTMNPLVVIAELKETNLESWKMFPASNLSVSVSSTSLSTFDDSSWYTATVPCTVMGALIENGVYPKDLYRGMQMLQVDTAQFNGTEHSWLFRTSFSLEGAARFKSAFLRFRGVSYRGRVFLNGQQVNKDHDLEGTFKFHDVPIDAAVTSNTLVVQVWRGVDEVWPPVNPSTDLSITWIDWSPFPPDGSMGLIRPVSVVSSTTGVILQYPVVNTTLVKNGTAANVTVSVELYNPEGVSGSLSLTMTLADRYTATTMVSALPPAGQRVLVTFPSVLVTDSPLPLWYPWQMGEPTMVPLVISSSGAPAAAETLKTMVGLRQVVSGLTDTQPRPYRYYDINGRRLLIRGAGWANELLLQGTRQRAIDQMRLAKHLGLNMIRLEGQLLNDEIFDEADASGMLVVPGISCCDAWQHWQAWTKETLKLAQESIASQVKRARSHPCSLAFWYSSDELPPAWVESAYLDVFANERWPNGLLNSASDVVSNLTGHSGVKMSGPYQWVPPVFWLQQTPDMPGEERGGAWGFLSEGGPGAAPMTWESLNASIVDLWPMGDDWDYHAANPQGYFGKGLRFFNGPLFKRYGGVPVSARDYSVRAQAAAYESHRAYFEAYNYNKPLATGYVQWMLQPGRPQNEWHLIEYSNMLGGAAFGAQVAHANLHVMLNPVDNSVAIVNGLFQHVQGPLSVVARLFATNGTQLWSQRQTISTIAGDAVLRNVLSVADPIRTLLPEQVRFLHLGLEGSSSDRNVYWLAPTSQQDIFNYTQSGYAPLAAYANFTELLSLPVPSLSLVPTYCNGGGGGGLCTSSLQVTNTGSSVAFFVRFRLVSSSGGVDVLPAFWSSNFETLFPGDSITVSVSYDGASWDSVSFVVEPFSQFVGK